MGVDCLARMKEVRLSEVKDDLPRFLRPIYSLHDVVPGEGIEPTLCCQNRILSPARLPVPPSRRGSGALSRSYDPISKFVIVSVPHGFNPARAFDEPQQRTRNRYRTCAIGICDR